MNRHDRASPRIERPSLRLRAFRNVLQGIATDVLFPGQVLALNASKVFFFEADTVVSGRLVSAVHRLCEVENSSLGCLLNLTRTDRANYEDAAAYYIDARTSQLEYRDHLMDGEAANAWLYAMERYACSSDKGKWLIYSESQNDIALIAFLDQESDRYSAGLKELSAEPIETLIRIGNLPHFSSLTPEWRQSLVKNYGASRMHITT